MKKLWDNNYPSSPTNSLLNSNNNSTLSFFNDSSIKSPGCLSSIKFITKSDRKINDFILKKNNYVNNESDSESTSITKECVDKNKEKDMKLKKLEEELEETKKKLEFENDLLK